MSTGSHIGIDVTHRMLFCPLLFVKQQFWFSIQTMHEKLSDL